MSGTQEIKKLWESTPKFVIETGLAGNHEAILAKALECMNWVADFQLKYKDEFRPLMGLEGIIAPSEEGKDNANS